MLFPILHLALLGLRLCVEYDPELKQIMYGLQAGPFIKEGVLKEF